jgi:hypothetical protein
MQWNDAGYDDKGQDEVGRTLQHKVRKCNGMMPDMMTRDRTKWEALCNTKLGNAME